MTETPIELELSDVHLTIRFTDEGREVEFTHRGSGFELPETAEELEVIKKHFEE